MMKVPSKYRMVIKSELLIWGTIGFMLPEKKLAVFDYQPSRSRQGPKAFLQNFKGYLQTDGYAAYNEIGRGDDIVLLGCMAHARRYFQKALDNDKERASYALSILFD